MQLAKMKGKLFRGSINCRNQRESRSNIYYI